MKNLKKHAGFGILLALIFLIGSFLIVLFYINFVFAQETNLINTNVCCEKTLEGAWCQNTLAENCDLSEGLRTTPTSCDATSFCKAGCCFDSQEGLCMESTPQKVCQDSGGMWADSKDCEIPQCQLGCCVIADQAAFVTLTRCKKLASFYGVESDFRPSISNEVQCITLAHGQDEGACVYEVDYIKTCKRTTRAECTIEAMNKAMYESDLEETQENEETTEEQIKGTITNSSIEFHKDFLCSAEDLATICGPTRKTTCVQGKDEVYFLDSCGNIANIYDASRINDKSYWRKIISKEESCGFNEGNKDSAECGNCDYLGGSYCREYQRGRDLKQPTYGDYVCMNLDCKETSSGESKQHGESWCYYDGETGEGQDNPGSKHYRHLCFFGEEIVEPCEDYRQQQCIEDDIDGFSQAACRVNKWQDCYSQDNQEDCENIAQRDCFWVEDIKLNVQAAGAIAPADNVETINEEDEDEEIEGGCLPQIPPGLKHWEAGEAQGICSIANSVCVVEFEKKLFGDEECVENCECLEESWISEQNSICNMVGDCGGDVNFIGTQGFKQGYSISEKEEEGDGLFGFNNALFKNRLGN